MSGVEVSVARSPLPCSASAPRPLARAPPTLASSKRPYLHDALGLKNGGVIGDDRISCLLGLSTYGVSFVHARMLYLLCRLAFSRYVDLAFFADLYDGVRYEWSDITHL